MTCAATLPSVLLSITGPRITAQIMRGPGCIPDAVSLRSKKEKPPLSLKGQQGGLGYRHWLGVTMTDQASGDCSAKVVRAYMEERVHSLLGEAPARLWCFGYDMDNMKARCWYEHEMPLFKLDATQRDNLLQWVKELVAAATDVSGLLRSQLKEAWFKRTKMSKAT